MHGGQYGFYTAPVVFHIHNIRVPMQSNIGWDHLLPALCYVTTTAQYEREENNITTTLGLKERKGEKFKAVAIFKNKMQCRDDYRASVSLNSKVITIVFLGSKVNLKTGKAISSSCHLCWLTLDN